MSITNYSELKTAVAGWAERGDLTKVIPDFISLTEARLNKSLHHPNMEQRSYVTLATTFTEPEFIDLPSGFQAMRRIYITSVTGHPTIDFVSEGQLAKERPRWGGGTGRPTKYTIFGSEIEVCPKPDSNYTLEMVYRTNLTPLNDNVTTNWLLNIAPDVYLYGALYQCAMYTGEEDKVARWQNYYETAVNDLTMHGRNLKYGGSPMAITIAGENTP